MNEYRKRERALRLAEMLSCAESLPDDLPLKAQLIACVEDAIERQMDDDEDGASEALLPALMLLNQHFLEQERTGDRS